MTEMESAIRETVEKILTPEIVEKARRMALQCANADEITEIVGRSLDGTEELYFTRKGSFVLMRRDERGLMRMEADLSNEFLLDWLDRNQIHAPLSCLIHDEAAHVEQRSQELLDALRKEITEDIAGGFIGGLRAEGGRQKESLAAFLEQADKDLTET